MKTALLQEIEELEQEEANEDDVYAHRSRESLIENDELSHLEDWFMEGYEEDQDKTSEIRKIEEE
jgi:hypothetical protein